MNNLHIISLYKLHNKLSCVSSQRRRARRVERVELDVSSVSSRVVWQARRSQNAWARHVECVESCRVETWRAKWNLDLCHARKQLATCATKIKWSVSGAGAGGRWNGNGAVSGQNLPLKMRSSIKPLKVKSSNRFQKLPRNRQCKFITSLFMSRINLIIWQRIYHFNYAVVWSGYFKLCPTWPEQELSNSLNASIFSLL